MAASEKVQERGHARRVDGRVLEHAQKRHPLI